VGKFLGKGLNFCNVSGGQLREEDERGVGLREKENTKKIV